MCSRVRACVCVCVCVDIFMGVALGAEVFMMAIEVVTAKEITKRVGRPPHKPLAVQSCVACARCMAARSDDDAWPGGVGVWRGGTHARRHASCGANATRAPSTHRRHATDPLCVCARQTTDADGKEKIYHVRVWNATVANLTLMALGSSAPEILLNVIEVLAGGFNAGALGPSTIVGSAAFNLMVITAVCIVCLPPGEKRTLKQLGVFLTTAFYSVLAYVWLFLMVIVFTPEVITVAEGVITCVLLLILIVQVRPHRPPLTPTPPPGMTRHDDRDIHRACSPPTTTASHPCFAHRPLNVCLCRRTSPTSDRPPLLSKSTAACPRMVKR